jgi:hypothetical protein
VTRQARGARSLRASYLLRGVVTATVLVLVTLLTLLSWPRGLHGPGTATGVVSTPDEYWESFTYFPPAITLDYDFESLEEMTQTVDVVLSGRIVRTYIGEEWVFAEGEPAQPLAYATVAIGQVLKGEPVSRTVGTVEVLLAPVGAVDVNAVSMPTDEYLWFLIYEPDWRAQLGKPPVESEIAQFAYFRPNHHQSVLRNSNGLVEVLRLSDVENAYGTEAFPVSLDGTSF